MDKNDRDSNPDLTKTKDDAETADTKVTESPAKSSSTMPKFQIDPSVFDEMPGTHFPTMQAKKKRNPAAMWLVLVLVLFLATGGYAAYQYTQALSQNDTLSQKDSQITALTSENAKLKSDASKANAEATEPTPAAPATDEAQIKQTAMQYICAGMTTSCTNLKADAPKISGDFAKVTITDQVGQTVYLKRVKTPSTGWVAFFSTQNGIPKATVEKYSFPSSLLSAGEVKDN